MKFGRKRGGAVKVECDETEAQVLTHLLEELLAVVEPPAVSDDPLAAMVGMPGGEVTRPDNPLLARLLPDAYADDADASTEFRRFTDADLRTAKRAAATSVLASLPPGGGIFRLERDQVDEWLTSLNDLRLLLGTAIGVTDDDDDFEDDEDGTFARQAYRWLTAMQDWLLSCIDPRPPT